MQIHEILNNPARWDIIPTTSSYEFDIDDEHYVVSFGRRTEGHILTLLKSSGWDEQQRDNFVDSLGDGKPFELDFQRVVNGHPTVEITKSKKPYKVFATVKDITKDFIKHNNCNAIIFSAKEKSRRKLYKRFLDYYDLDYVTVNVTVYNKDNQDIYIIKVP